MAFARPGMCIIGVIGRHPMDHESMDGERNSVPGLRRVVVDREVFPHILELEVRVFVPALHTGIPAVVLELNSLNIKVVENAKAQRRATERRLKQTDGRLSIAVPDTSDDHVQNNVGEPNLQYCRNNLKLCFTRDQGIGNSEKSFGVWLSSANT
ncbi:hypothetical protein B0H17DRAFT_1175338 [Mycena rosella]|uniref:Uncharacterized protein n=1 Tax=Mycena rosella TaxID=1033263 RepID=A0AAD7GUH0_MYCRO|nr:hypothetical protein B0H17DRAFT_1175338 [Mycena rosella]